MLGDLIFAKRIAVWSGGYDVTSAENSLSVTRRSSGVVVARYVGRQYKVVTEHHEPTIYSLMPTSNVMRWEN